MCYDTITNYLKNDFKIARKSPITTLITVMLGCFITFIGVKWHYNERIEILKERVELASKPSDSKNRKIIYNNTDTSLDLSISDLGNTYVIDNEKKVTINLPKVNSTNIGIGTRFVKMGTGYLAIVTDGKSKFADLFEGDILRNYTDEKGATVDIQLTKPSTWIYIGYPHGTWMTEKLK